MYFRFHYIAFVTCTDWDCIGEIRQIRFSDDSVDQRYGGAGGESVEHWGETNRSWS